MKKLLCVILTAAMLVGFAVMSVANNELHAQGEALLRETMVVLDGGGFTLWGEGIVITRDGERFAVDNGIVPGAFWVRWLLGGGYVLREGENAYLVFPERRLQLAVGRRAPNSVAASWFWYRLAYGGTPNTIVVRQVEDYIGVLFDDEMRREFFYRDGQLRYIVMHLGIGMPIQVQVESLAPMAEQGLLETAGLLRLPRWVWGPAEFVGNLLTLPVTIVQFLYGLFVPQPY